MRFGEELAPALLGLDQLYADEQAAAGTGTGSDLDRLVVLNLSMHLVPETFSSFEDAEDRFATLRDMTAALPEPDRQLYYRQGCESAIAFAQWRARGLSFQDQITRFLHVPPRPASDQELMSLQRDMGEVLGELGYAGDLPQRFAAWEARQTVPPEAVNEVLTELLSAAWDRTAERMEMPGVKSDGMRVETVTGVPYNAMCDFSRRLIRLNTEPTLTRPSLKHLAVHEGYPGHYVQFKRRQTSYAAGVAPADVLLSVVNTASSSTFEGIADVGMDVIGWQTEPDDRLAALLARYRSGLGTRAAWRLHAEGWTPEKVREELLRDALVGGEGWVDARIRFISAHDRAALIWSYWWGAPSVGAVWNRVRDDPARQPAYFSYIYDRMHSPESIAMFAG
jgi:hypothetical protein